MTYASVSAEITALTPDTSSKSVSDPERALLRHAVATVAYRGGKILRGVPPDFAEFRSAESTRTPIRLLSHINDLFDWALSLAEGEQRWRDSTPQAWDEEVRRFFEGLQRFDDYLASDRPLGSEPGRLFQGPVADALTHIGQLGILRR